MGKHGQGNVVRELNSHGFKDVYFSTKQKVTLYVELASKYLSKEEMKG